MPRVSAEQKRLTESRLKAALLAGQPPEEAARIVGCGKTKAYEIFKSLGGREGIRRQREAATLKDSGLGCGNVEVLEVADRVLTDAFAVRQGLVPPPDEPPEGYWDEAPDEADIDFYISELSLASPLDILAGLARHRQRGGVHVMTLRGASAR